LLPDVGVGTLVGCLIENVSTGQLGIVEGSYRGTLGLLARDRRLMRSGRRVRRAVFAGRIAGWCLDYTRTVVE
jgi:hypothetical protein